MCVRVCGRPTGVIVTDELEKRSFLSSSVAFQEAMVSYHLLLLSKRRWANAGGMMKSYSGSQPSRNSSCCFTNVRCEFPHYY